MHGLGRRPSPPDSRDFPLRGDTFGRVLFTRIPERFAAVAR